MAIIASSARASQIAAAGFSDNPFVAWENLGTLATLGGSAVLAGGERANALSGSTYDKWRPVTGGTLRVLEFDFGTPRSLNFAALAGHNIASLPAEVRVQISANATTWTDVGAVTVPPDNSPIAWRFVATSSRYWRFAFTAVPTAGLLSVSVAFLGNELLIPSRLYQGFAPVLTPTEVQLQSNVSIGGELLGSSVISRGSRLSADITLVPGAFIRSADWLAFQRHFGEGKGFFFGWRPAQYPQDLHYCARDGEVIRPSNTGPRDYMAINFSARVYANG